MADIIQLLPDHVANQIAAGEVVQRPASVVKELLENAIDAGATNITLILKDAGKTLIQVIDNGAGMSETDARLCFERHATSKINCAEDLFNLKTKGFRGEAMASIAAIAHVELKTKQSNQELGTLIKIEGSKIASQEVINTPTGTSVAVKNLFFNIPARRNFLKSDNIETRHIIDEFQRVALVHHDIGFSLYHNDNELYVLKASNLRQRIVAILGKKTNEKLVPINEDTDIASFQGFIGKPEFSKKKRGEQFFFVNDRFIKSSYLHHAVVSAFDGLLSSDLHPSYFLYIKVPNNTIDINIHPTKTEIKFDNEKALYAMLRATVKHSLGQYNLSPVLDFNRDATLDTPYKFNKTSAPTSEPKISVDPNFNPFKTEAKSTSNFSSGTNYKKKENTGNWESLYTDVFDDKTVASKNEIFIQDETNTSQESLFEDTSSSIATYQVHKKYIVSSIKSGITFIHQNLAHQRILYEEFLENFTVKEASSQQLLFPLNIHFSKEEINQIKEIQSDLESTGFLFDKVEDEVVIIKGIPTSISESEVTIILEQLLEDINHEIPDNSFSQLDILAKSLAKSLAIKTGTVLSSEEQRDLVDRLFLCKDPLTSPYGKRIYSNMDLKEIDKKFDN